MVARDRDRITIGLAQRRKDMLEPDRLADGRALRDRLRHMTLDDLIRARSEAGVDRRTVERLSDEEPW